MWIKIPPKKSLVAQTVARWNQITAWLVEIDLLRRDKRDALKRVAAAQVEAGLAPGEGEEGAPNAQSERRHTEPNPSPGQSVPALVADGREVHHSQPAEKDKQDIEEGINHDRAPGP